MPDQRSPEETIALAQLLSHQAGLAWIEAEMSLEEALSWDPVVDALAQQVPHWKPGSRHGYHATTYGWLVGEVIRRITGAMHTCFKLIHWARNETR